MPQGSHLYNSPKKVEVELHPDAWRRFERAMSVVVKAPPQHRVKKKRSKSASRKRKAHPR